MCNSNFVLTREYLSIGLHVCVGCNVVRGADAQDHGRGGRQHSLVGVSGSVLIIPLFPRAGSYRSRRSIIVWLLRRSAIQGLMMLVISYSGSDKRMCSVLLCFTFSQLVMAIKRATLRVRGHDFVYWV